MASRLAAFEARLGAVLDCTPWRLSFFFALVTLLLSPFFLFIRQPGFTFDWVFFEMYDEVARQTILEHHQLPIWDPYFCGGIPLLGNPQTTFLVPTFPLVLIFGTSFGERLSNIPVLVLGCEGMWRLLRHLGAGRAAAMLSSLAFPLHHRVFQWLNNGQHGLTGFVLSGWVIYGFLRGLERPVYLAIGAFFFAWEVCFRGMETTPQVAMGVVLWAIFEARRRLLQGAPLPSVGWPILAGLWLGLLSLGYAGLRMFPAIDLLLRSPRVVVETQVNNLTQAFFELYALRHPYGEFGAGGYVYVGVPTYVLFCGAVLFSRTRARAGVPLLATLWFMLLTLGMHGPASPLFWIHKVPILSSLRIPTFWSFGAAFFLVIAASLSLDELLRFLRERGLSIAAAVIGAGVVLGVGVDLSLLDYWAISGPNVPFTSPPVPRVKQDFKQTRGCPWEFQMWPYIDRGSLACYDEFAFRGSPLLSPDAPAEERFADPNEGRVSRVAWSENRIVLDVEARHPGRVYVNQNWNAGWQASRGVVRSVQGLLAVDVPEGRYRLELRMWPRLVTLGLGALLVALAATAWLLVADRRQRLRATGS